MKLAEVPNKTYVPLEHQVEGMQHILDWWERGYNYGALFLDMGLGKSYCSIMLAVKLYLEGKIDRVLVVAPNGITDQWINEQFPEHCVPDYVDHLWQNKKTKIYSGEKRLFFSGKTSHLKLLTVNIDRFSYGGLDKIPEIVDFVRDGKTLIIVDEATDIKNHKSNRTENLTELGREADYKLILTGTPVTNSPFDVYAMVNFLKPGFWKVPYHVFEKRYGLMVRDRNKHFMKPITNREFNLIRSMGQSEMTVQDIAAMVCMDESSVKFIIDNPNHDSSYKNIEDLKEILRPFCFFKKKEECIDLPEKMYQTLYVDMTANQTKIYNELVKKGMSEFEGEELTIQNKLTLTLRLQQVTGGFFPYHDEEMAAKYEAIDAKNPKIELLKHEIKESGDQKIIIWARFRAEIEAIEKELSKEFPDKIVSTYYGKVSKADREKRKQAFQNGEIDILVMNQQTGSMGLNFQIATLQYFFSNSYSIKDRMQCEDRSHRMGQTKPVMYKEIVCRGTVDKKIVSSLMEKKDFADSFRSGATMEEIFF